MGERPLFAQCRPSSASLLDMQCLGLQKVKSFQAQIVANEFGDLRII